MKNTIAPELQSISKWLRDLEARSAGGALAGASSVRSAWRSTWPDGVKVRKAIEELARKIAARLVLVVNTVLQIVDADPPGAGCALSNGKD